MKMFYPLRELLQNSLYFTDIPSKKEEKWRFSRLASYLQREYRKAAPTTEENAFTPKEKHWIILKDGQLMSHQLPSSVHLKRHFDGLGNSLNPFSCLASSSAFSPIELSCFEDIDFSVYFIYSDKSFISSSLNLILKEGVKAKIYLSYEGAQESFVSHASHIKLDAYARVHLVQSQNLSQKALFISQNTLHLHESAYLKSFSLLYGGEYIHTFVHADLHYNSEADITSLLLGKDEQREIFSCDIEHLADLSRSRVLSKQVIKDKSVCVFDAKSTIHAKTKATQAKQSSHALLLDEGAQIHSKPHLEIYSDELSASHGSTVGELDPEALSYLLSRGINKEKAKSMLILAFVNEALEKIDDPLSKERISALIGESDDRL